MKLKIFASTVVLTSLFTINPSLAENLASTQQLLSTKQCPGCDLTNAGLSLANLTGANLAGANLAGANLSRANLAGADLSGANLSGTSLFGANLSGANLSGAIFSGTDLRSAYLINTNLTGANLNNAVVYGAVGLTTQVASAEQFYKWGVAEAQKGAYQDAIEYYNRALEVKPDLAAAYFARSMSRADLGDYAGALQDAQTADKLFATSNNKQGQELSQKLMVMIQARQQPRKLEPSSSGNSIMGALGSIVPLLLRFMY
jgi:tetratricopeptide (TPR) repeat protein